MLIPGIFYMETMFTRRGRARRRATCRTPGSIVTVSAMTPETERTTHFFWAYLNNFEGDDPPFPGRCLTA